MQKSILKLVRRSLAAARLGFAFYGTSQTTFPKTVRLRGQRTPLSVPQDGGYLYDLINVWLDDEYGMHSIDFPPRTVLDIGANVGLFSLWAAHNFPGATIHAYEPNPKVHPHLSANLRGTSVKLFSTGLGAKRGRAEVLDHGQSRLASTTPNPEGVIEIEPIMDALDRLGGGVDLMKIDQCSPTSLLIEG